MPIYLCSNAQAINTDTLELLVCATVPYEIPCEFANTKAFSDAEYQLFKDHKQHYLITTKNAEKQLSIIQDIKSYDFDDELFLCPDFISWFKKEHLGYHPSNAMLHDPSIDKPVIASSFFSYRLLTNCEVLLFIKMRGMGCYLLKTSDPKKYAVALVSSDHVVFGVVDVLEQATNETLEKILRDSCLKLSTPPATPVNTAFAHLGGRNDPITLSITDLHIGSDIEAIHIHAPIEFDYTYIGSEEAGLRCETNSDIRHLLFVDSVSDTLHALQLEDYGYGYSLVKYASLTHVYADQIQTKEAIHPPNTSKELSRLLSGRAFTSALKSCITNYLKSKGVQEPNRYIGSIHPDHIMKGDATVILGCNLYGKIVMELKNPENEKMLLIVEDPKGLPMMVCVSHKPSNQSISLANHNDILKWMRLATMEQQEQLTLAAIKSGIYKVVNDARVGK